MKRIILTLAIALSFAFSSFAQFMPDSTLINFTSKDGDLLITFGGQELIFGDIPASVPHKTQAYIEFANAYSLGWNFVPNVDHSVMATGADYLDFRTIKSAHFEFEMVSFGLKFPSKNQISAGISLSADNYRFNDNITIKNIDGKIVPVPLDNVTKSKFKGFYLGFPLTLDLYLGSGFYLSPTASFNILAKSNTKYKAPKTKANLTGLNEYQFNYGIRFTRRGEGFFINYSPTPIFKDGVGAKANRLTFGIVIFG